MAVVGTYYTDADASRAELTRLVDSMAAGGRITASDAAFAKADIDAAYATADAATWFGADAETFWSDLGARVNAHIATYAAWGGGKKSAQGRSVGQSYTDTVVSGLTALNSARATEYASSWSAFYGQVVEQSAADYATVAEKVGETVTNPWWVAGVAALVLGLVALKGRR